MVWTEILTFKIIRIVVLTLTYTPDVEKKWRQNKSECARKNAVISQIIIEIFKPLLMHQKRKSKCIIKNNQSFSVKTPCDIIIDESYRRKSSVS